MAARRLRAVAGHIGSASSGGGRPFTAAAATAVQKDLVVQKRGAAAIVGCLVADAAATPSHWVYDQSSLAQSATRETAAFMEPINPFYHIVPGNVLPKPPSHNIARIATCLGRVAAAGAPPTTHVADTSADIITGQNSCYGDQTAALLASIVETGTETPPLRPY